MAVSSAMSARPIKNSDFAATQHRGREKLNSIALLQLNWHTTDGWVSGTVRVPMFSVLRSYDAPEFLVIAAATMFVVGSFFYYAF